MKKLIAFIFAALFAVVVYAHQYETTINGVTWYYNLISDGKGGYNAEITYRGDYWGSYSGSLTIPTTLEGFKVTTIGEAAFYSCVLLESVTIPEGVTTFGSYAFYGCNSLTSVMIPNGVIEIGDSVFEGCSLLMSVTIPDSVTAVGSSVFTDCNSLKEIVGWRPGCPKNVERIIISSTVTAISAWEFYKCNSLESVTIPEGVTVIGRSAFEGCSSLVSVTIPNSVETIGVDAFCNCSSMKEIIGWMPGCPRNVERIVISDSVTTIEGSAFAYCSSLTSVTMPNSVKTIGDYAFAYCSSLASVTIPDGVTSIGSHAFDGCRSLTSVTIPNAVKVIGDSAFDDCSSLMSVTIPESVTELGRCAFSGCSSLTILTILGGIETIEYMAFSDCSSLESVTISEGVRTIGGYAFYGCSSLTSVTIPEGVTTIEGYAFYGCSSLTSVSIPEGVTTIGGCAFAGCRSLVSVIIPDSITGFGTCAFRDCCDLVRVDIRNVKSWCAISFGDEDANPLYYARRLYLNDKEVVVLEIPEEIQTINEYAFCNCSFIERVVVPNSVTHIDSKAFLGCENIRDVELPSRWILSSIFPDSYKNLLKVVVSKGCVSILDSMFKGCTGLESVIIPGSVLKMGNSVFYDCASLKDVVFEGDAPECGADTFYGTPKRVVVSVPNGSIGWSGGVTDRLPEIWEGRLIAHTGDAIEWPTIIAGGTSMALTSVTVTNVVVHYVLNSVQPEFAKPVSEDTGFVNVIAEVKGMSVAVPQTWTEEYPKFTEKFGSDFTKALMAKSGKTAAGGREMLVWEDYVAGTDPTDPNDKFTATMTIVDGKPVISWTPELDAERAAMRKYTTYGKRSLLDLDWEVVPVGHESEYNFFKVSVEMR